MFHTPHGPRSQFQSTALLTTDTVDAVDTVDTVDIVYTDDAVDMAYTVNMNNDHVDNKQLPKKIKPQVNMVYTVDIV